MCEQVRTSSATDINTYIHRIPTFGVGTTWSQVLICLFEPFWMHRIDVHKTMRMLGTYLCMYAHTFFCVCMCCCVHTCRYTHVHEVQQMPPGETVSQNKTCSKCIFLSKKTYNYHLHVCLLALGPQRAYSAVHVPKKLAHTQSHERLSESKRREDIWTMSLAVGHMASLHDNYGLLDGHGDTISQHTLQVGKSNVKCSSALITGEVACSMTCFIVPGFPNLQSLCEHFPSAPAKHLPRSHSPARNLRYCLCTLLGCYCYQKGAQKCLSHMQVWAGRFPDHHPMSLASAAALLGLAQV